jgi:hypothetical protein
VSTTAKIVAAGVAVAVVWWLWEDSRASARGLADIRAMQAQAGGAKIIQFPRFALGGRSPWILS